MNVEANACPRNANASMTEEQYRGHYLQADIAQMRFALLLLALPNRLFFGVDLISGFDSQTPALTMGLRAFFLFVSAVVSYRLGRVSDIKPFDQMMVLWSASGIALLIGNSWARPADYFGHYLYEIFAVLTYFSVVPLMPNVKLLLSLPYAAASLVLLFFFKRSTEALYVANTAFLLPMTLIAGYLIALRIERYRRAAVIATRELEVMARTDALTGVANRRAFMHWADIEVSRARRSPEEGLAVLIIDIDHFKAVNDAFGHSAGDQLLVDFCRRVEAVLRYYDQFARMGGEEFVIGLPRCSLTGAAATAERIRAAVADEPFVVNGTAVRKTISIGVATLHPGESEIDAALGRADAALYAAKRSGRNCVLTEADLDDRAAQDGL